VVETLTAPYLLLAAPDLADPNFQRSVVLMGHHSRDGAVGWIVNRVVEGGASALLVGEVARTIHPDTPLRIGGPVATPGLVVVHREPVEDVPSLTMAPGLLVCASVEVLPRLFGDEPGREAPLGLLIYGYSGWGPGQLEREMEDGSWLVLPFEPGIAFPASVSDLWERALARLGLDPGSVSSQPGGVN
jgi:putative transcriptional regulator